MSQRRSGRPACSRACGANCSMNIRCPFGACSHRCCCMMGRAIRSLRLLSFIKGVLRSARGARSSSSTTAQRLLQEQPHPPGFARRQAPVRQTRCAQLNTGRECGIRIVFIKDNLCRRKCRSTSTSKHSARTASSAPPDAEIVYELDPEPGEFPTRKKHYSAFNSTRLDALRRASSISSASTSPAPGPKPVSSTPRSTDSI